MKRCAQPVRLVGVSMLAAAACLALAGLAESQPVRRVQGAGGAGPPGVAGSVISSEDPVPAGLPVVLHVDTPNTSDRPAKRLLAGPGKYLEATGFVIRLSEAGGQSHTLRPRNGQWSRGRLRGVTVEPGDTLRTPLAIDPLPAGEYEGELRWTGTPLEPGPEHLLSRFKLRVADDEALRNPWVAARIADARRGEPFAAFVAMTWRVGPVLDTMFADLGGEDRARAATAAAMLTLYWPRKDVPAAWGDAVGRALEKHAADPPVPRGGPNLGAALVTLAARQPLDLYLPALLTYSHSEDHDTFDAAVMALQSYHQPASSDRLAEVLEHAGVGWLAAHALANRGDERGVPWLAREARSGGHVEFPILVMYPDIAVAREAVDAGLTSADPKVRRAAERAQRVEWRRIDPLSRPAPPPGAAPPPTMSDAVRVVLAADVFVVPDAATAADPGPVVLAFRALNAADGRHAAMARLRRAGTTAAKLYGLCGLYYLREDRFRAAANELIASHGDATVTVIDGAAAPAEIPVREVVRRIASRELADRITRMYPAARAP